MRRLVPYLLPLVAFAAAAVIAAPGMAGTRAHSAQTPADTCVPEPACLPTTSSSEAAPVLCCWKTGYGKASAAQTGDCCDVDTLTAALDAPLANGGDALDDYAKGWASCILNNGFIYAFTIGDPTFNQLPESGVEGDFPKVHAASPTTDQQACLAKAGKHHGTTFYKPYGKVAVIQPIFGLTKAYHGNYGHKYDHEMEIRHCGGRGDDDCWQEVLLRNKTGGGQHAYNYCSGLGYGGSGFCPNASYVYIQVGVPWCKIGAFGHAGKIRNSCWYVY